MKASVIFIISIILLTISGCKKSFSPPPRSNSQAIDYQYLYCGWGINTENPDNYNETQNSLMFKDKKQPTIIFFKNKTYTLQYLYGKNDSMIYEVGTWNSDFNSQSITLGAQGKPSVTYKIVTLTEDYLTLITSYNKTIYVNNAEGVLTPQTQRIDEILYMHDL